jgi:hypothetical protein
MALREWRETLVTQKVDSPLQATFTTAKSIFGVDGTDEAAECKYTLPANFFLRGKSLTIALRGDISNIVTTPGLIFFQVMLGAVIAFTTSNIQLSTTAHTTLPFWLDLDLTCQVGGAGTQAKLMGQGKIISQCVANTAVADSVANTLPTLLVPNTTPAQGTGFDATAAQKLDIFVGFTISNAGNGVRARQYKLIADN